MKKSILSKARATKVKLAKKVVDKLMNWAEDETFLEWLDSRNLKASFLNSTEKEQKTFYGGFQAGLLSHSTLHRKMINRKWTTRQLYKIVTKLL